MIRLADPVLTNDDSELTVVNVDLKFNNHELIDILVKRNQYCKEKDLGKRWNQEQEIREHINSEWQKLQVPLACYLTFESEEGRLRAETLNGMKIEEPVGRVSALAGENFQISRVTEPSNMYYENENIVKWEKIWRRLLTFTVLFNVLFIGWCILFAMMRINDNFQKAFPWVDCEELYKAYGSDSNLQLAAQVEFGNLEENGFTQANLVKYSTPNIQCYCERSEDKLGYSDARNKEYEVNEDGTKFKGKMCD